MKNLPAKVPIVTFKFRVNFGHVFINPHGNKPYSIDNWKNYESKMYVFADGRMEPVR